MSLRGGPARPRSLGVGVGGPGRQQGPSPLGLVLAILFQPWANCCTGNLCKLPFPHFEWSQDTVAPATVNAADTWLKFLSKASPSKLPSEISSGSKSPLLVLSALPPQPAPPPPPHPRPSGLAFTWETE